MSSRDGYLKNKELYITSDIALAAYLLMRGFTLLGAVDTGLKFKEFGLTHTEPEALKDLKLLADTLADEFENAFFISQIDPGIKVNFKLYREKQRELHRALDEPVRQP